MEPCNTPRQKMTFFSTLGFTRNPSHQRIPQLAEGDTMASTTFQATSSLFLNNWEFSASPMQIDLPDD